MRVRYVALPLLTIRHLLQYRDDLKPYATLCSDWLLRARNSDGGWGDEANDQASKLFPTFLAIRALQFTITSDQSLEASCQWVLSRATPEGWSLYPGEQISAVATAYGVLCLTKTKHRQNDLVQAGHRFLLQTKFWGPISETIAGTLWQHNTYTWVLTALVELGDEPYSPVIAEGVRYMNSLKHAGSPWTEAPSQSSLSIRGQYWAVMALVALRDAFDPGIYALRIDASRASAELSEPSFLKFLMHSQWAMVFPARLYRYATYSLLAFGTLVAFSTHRLLDRIPREVDLGIALVVYLLSWKMMDLRRAHFPRLHRFIKIIVILLLAIGTLFGVDEYTTLSTARNLLSTGLQWLLQHF